MKRFKYIALIIIFLLLTRCKESNEINPLILNEWRLFAIYEGYWFIVPDSPVLTMEFSSNGKYIRAIDGVIKCYGNYVFKNKNTIHFIPTDCGIIIESVETIYKLTNDTLIISNHSISISSYGDRRDKYIRYNGSK